MQLLRRQLKRGWIAAGLEFKVQDVWIGVFWRHYPPYNSDTYDAPCWDRTEIWICLVPCVPIHIMWQGEM